MKVNVDIQNVSKGYNEPFIVARVIDNKLWFYGRYDTKELAESIASDFDNAIIVEVAE